jgi:hypothetical protein
MNDTPVTPAAPQFPSGAGPAQPAAPRPTRRWLKLAVGVGAAAGVAVGATALAQAATSSGGTPQSDATITASGSTSTTTTVPEHFHGFVGPGRFGAGFGGPGGPGLGGGPFIYGQFTVKGPNGYETISERSGTVSDVADTSGSTWSLTVKSADGTSATFTVDSGTSVNGGEMGIGSVKTGDTVRVTAVVSGGTSTAKQVTDETVLQANGGSWRPTGPPMGPGPTGNTGSASAQANTPPL